MTDVAPRTSPFRPHLSPSSGPSTIPSPDFGQGVAHQTRACTPRELYRALLQSDEHVHYFEPAFRFLVALLLSPMDLPLEQAAGAPPHEYAASIVDIARRHVDPISMDGAASSWSARVAREFAPAGLVDGIWLQGLTQIAHVEDATGMAALEQLMIRSGDPGTSASYPHRYDALLRSIGVAPGSIERWERDEMSPCADLSYEHALLGMAMALFPGTLRAETVGFNLWMAAVGPCPLLERVADDLRSRGACLTYLDAYDRERLSHSASRMVGDLLSSDGSDAMRNRIARGFSAAHQSYVRWQRAMGGANVPFTARQCVVEMVGRKARFARGHHGRVRVGGCPLEQFFTGETSAHEALVDGLEKSPWVRPAAPERSRLLNESISIDGPMFEIFTPAEQADLREWIARMGAADAMPAAEPRVPLSGVYTPPQDPIALERYALERFKSASNTELMFRLVNADQCPPIRVFAKTYAEKALSAVRRAFTQDRRLNAAAHPTYSDEVVSNLVIANHDRNVDAQRRPADLPDPMIGAVLDGCWLQGFANVLRVSAEEYGWLFRIYASELGDGVLLWNHNYIGRQMYRERVPAVMLPATDRRLYDALPVGVVQIVNVAMALNTHHFLPELLGLNLSIEARGVCGTYITTWKNCHARGADWAAKYFRLHNSIDNYASGHTKWSLAAVQSYLARVKDAAPQAVDDQWRRIWEFWRFSEIQQHGTASELEALRQNLGGMAHQTFASAG